MLPNERMLCRRSASLMSTARMSRRIESRSWRKLFSCLARSGCPGVCDLGLVTTCTRKATSSPNSRRMSSMLVGVSSTTSCKKPAATELASIMKSSAMIVATATGCMM